MRDGVNDGFGDGQTRQLVSDRGLVAYGPGADGTVDLAHNEIHRLIDKFEDGPLIDLIGRDGLADFGSVEMHALDLGGDKETLRLFPEKENRRVA
ncbi:MAG: hypothetical protein Q7I93_07055, partial [Syntrophales bacterium]|nr:hypothetical protein [Syntrophales bacterium]